MGEANPIMYLLLAYSCVVSSGCPWLRGKLEASVLHFKTNVYKIKTKSHEFLRTTFLCSDNLTCIECEQLC